jgi:hypothetical protein
LINRKSILRVLKKRLLDEGNETVTNCNALKMKAARNVRLTPNLTLPCPYVYAILKIRCDKQRCLFTNNFGTYLALSFFILKVLLFFEALLALDCKTYRQANSVTLSQGSPNEET